MATNEMAGTQSNPLAGMLGVLFLALIAGVILPGMLKPLAPVDGPAVAVPQRCAVGDVVVIPGYGELVVDQYGTKHPEYLELVDEMVQRGEPPVPCADGRDRFTWPRKGPGDRWGIVVAEAGHIFQGFEVSRNYVLNMGEHYGCRSYDGVHPIVVTDTLRGAP